MLFLSPRDGLDSRRTNTRVFEEIMSVSARGAISFMILSPTTHGEIVCFFSPEKDDVVIR